jgi:alpha-methylacyl-CoA racemase
VRHSIIRKPRRGKKRTGDEEFAGQMDRRRWVALNARLTDLFATKTRAEWCALMEHTDVCFAPVLVFVHAHPDGRGQLDGRFEGLGGRRGPPSPCRVHQR